MVGCIGNLNTIVNFFVGMVGMAKFPSSLSSPFSSVSPLVVPLMLIFVPWLLVTIAGELSYFSTIVICSCPFASFSHIWWYLVVLGGNIGASLVVFLVVVSGVFGSGLGDCILYCIGVLISGTIESCGVSNSLCFLRNRN